MPLKRTIFTLAFASVSMACGGVVAEQTDAGTDAGSLVSHDAAPEASGVMPVVPEAGIDSGAVIDAGSGTGSTDASPTPVFCPQTPKYGGEFMNALASGHYTACPTGMCPTGDCCANFGPQPWICVSL